VTAAGPPAARGRRSGARVFVPAALFVYLLFVRTRGITDSFLLLGDQILYWKMALGRFRDLPLAGPSSIGTTIGPAFVWMMWGIRHLVGPWTDNLPHAGGIGISILQSTADVLLMVGLWRKTGSLTLALAVSLLVATAPFDLSLSATIWNPPVALAFVKATLAIVCLARPGGSLWWGIAATITGVLAVQAHSSAIFVAVPVIASFVIEDLIARRWTMALQRSRATIEVLLILELPYLFNLAFNRPEHAGPAMVLDSVASSLAGSTGLRLGDAFRAVGAWPGVILLSPWSFAGFGVVLLLSLIVAAWRLRRDVLLLSATVFPVMLTVAGFSTWQRGFDEYWFMAIAPSVAIALALALTAWRPAAPIVAGVALAIVVLAQPARIASAMTIHRLPEYGAMLRGTREVFRRAPEVRGIDTDFPLPPSADREFMYRILGGRVTPTAPFIATIARSGAVAFKPAGE
jgi:hypothetical protein